MEGKKIRHIDWLDVARFLAAVSVMFFHYAYFGIFKGYVSHINDFGLLSKLSRYGYLGVDVFFIISGYVIAISAENKSAEKFAISRLLRLYPLFWACLLFSTILIYLVGMPWAAVSIMDVLKNFTMFPEPLGAKLVDGVYWTLKIEMQFYAYVFCILLLGQWKNFKLIAGSLIIGMASMQLIQPGALQGTNYYFLFGIGVFLSFIGKQGFKPINVGILCIATWMAVLNAVARVSSINYLSASPSVSTLFIATFILVVVGLFTLAISSELHKISIPYARIMGALTYPVYLIHSILGYHILQYAAPYIGKWLALFIAIIATFIVSLSLHFLIEVGMRPYSKMFFTWLCTGCGRVRKLARFHPPPEQTP